MNYEIKITGSGSKNQIIVSLNSLLRYLEQYQGEVTEDDCGEMPISDNAFEDATLQAEIS